MPFIFLKLNVPFVPSNISPAVQSQRERGNFIAPKKRCEPWAPRCRPTGCDNGFSLSLPALSRVPLHPTQFLICLSHNPSNLTCKWKIIKLSAWQSITVHQSTQNGHVSLHFQIPFCHGCCKPATKPQPAGDADSDSLWSPRSGRQYAGSPLWTFQHLPWRNLP